MPKWKKSAAKASFATFMQPLQCDLRPSAAKHNSIMPAAAAVRNLDAGIPLRPADTELQTAMEFTHNGYTQIAAICSSKTGSRRQSGKTTILKHFLKEISKGNHQCQNGKNCCKSIICNSHAAITMRSADTELKSTMELQHSTVEHIAWMQQFQCAKHLNTCKTQKHSISKEGKKSPGTFSSTARAVRARFYGKARTPATVAQASQLFSAANLLLPEKTQCFVQILTFKSHP